MVEQIDISTILPDEKIDEKKVFKEIKRPAANPEDKPWKGDKVLVHYVGTLEDGSQFDSSRTRDGKFSFTLGKGEVIKGWDFGIATMAKGELAVFTIHSDFAYGDVGSPPRIPGGATLTFEVELFEFEGEDISPDKDKSITRRIKTAGEGFDHPNDGANVNVEIIGYNSKGEFDKRDLSFVFGEGCEIQVPKGVEMALEKMKRKEEAQICIVPNLTVGGLGVPKDNQEVLKYDINLKSFERAKESWQMDGEEKLEQSKIFKAKGTDFFKQGKYDMANTKYNKIIEFLEHEISLKGDKEEERASLLQAGRLNLAMCKIKVNDWMEARNLCDKVVEEDDKCIKGYFRRGEALVALNEHALAMTDFEKVLELDADNKAAKNKVAMCVRQIKANKQKEKKTFANMFDKFAKIDAKKAEEAKRREKPVEINEWDDEEKEKCQMYVDQNDVENGQNGQKEPNGNEAEAAA